VKRWTLREVSMYWGRVPARSIRHLSGGLAEVESFDGRRRRDIWQASHSERVSQAEEPGGGRDKEGNLKGAVSGLRVDDEDCVLDLLGLVGDLVLELCVAHDLGVGLHLGGNLLLLGRGNSGAGVGQMGEAQGQRAGGVFLSMLYFFLFFIWIWILITVFIDIFRSHDMGGGAKALWVIFVIILPFLGVLVYLIARGGKMQERKLQDVAQQQNAFDQAVREAAGTSGGDVASQLSQLADLKSQGILTDAEFEAQKSKILAS